MNLEVFCYLGLMCFPEQLPLSLALLPEEQRKEAMSFLETVKELPREELGRRWSRLREGEWALLRRLAAQSGIRLDELPPVLRPYYVAWLVDQNGAKNPQS